MTADDHVRAIHVFATRNPAPGIGVFHLSPASGRAEVTTRIRLADDQEVIVSRGNVRQHIAATERLRRGFRRRLHHLSQREKEEPCHAPASACPVPPPPVR